MTTALQTLTNKLAERFEMGSSEDLPKTLMATAFKGLEVSPDQMTALLIVANQYGLNPWTNEIYAFPSNSGIVPIVGVDGWARIINENPQFDGIEFDQDAESCTCRIYRKDRSRPTSVTEYMTECQRNTNPWKSHPKRMLRHKAMMQCARLAFGFTGIFDQDEADRIIENERKDVTPKPKVIETKHIELATDEQIQRITELAGITNTPIESILALVGVQSLSEIPKESAVRVLNKLNVTLDKQKNESNENLGEAIPL